MHPPDQTLVVPKATRTTVVITWYIFLRWVALVTFYVTFTMQMIQRCLYVVPLLITLVLSWTKHNSKVGKKEVQQEIMNSTPDQQISAVTAAKKYVAPFPMAAVTARSLITRNASCAPPVRGGSQAEGNI